MKNLENKVAIRIEALDPSGAVVPIQIGSNGIEPGPNTSVRVTEAIQNIDLIKEVGVDPIDSEIVILAFHDIMDHALVTWNESFVLQQNKPSIRRIQENSIRAFLLPSPGISVTLFARTHIPDLTLTHPQIAGYRFTREIPARVPTK